MGARLKITTKEEINMFCRECGTKNTVHDNFCESCGSKLIKPRRNVPMNQQQNRPVNRQQDRPMNLQHDRPMTRERPPRHPELKPNKTLIVTGLLAVLLVGVIALSFLFRGGSDADEPRFVEQQVIEADEEREVQEIFEPEGSEEHIVIPETEPEESNIEEADEEIDLVETPFIEEYLTFGDTFNMFATSWRGCTLYTTVLNNVEIIQVTRPIPTEEEDLRDFVADASPPGIGIHIREFESGGSHAFLRNITEFVKIPVRITNTCTINTHAVRIVWFPERKLYMPSNDPHLSRMIDPPSHFSTIMLSVVEEMTGLPVSFRHPCTLIEPGETAIIYFVIPYVGPGDYWFISNQVSEGPVSSRSNFRFYINP